MEIINLYITVPWHNGIIQIYVYGISVCSYDISYGINSPHVKYSMHGAYACKPFVDLCNAIHLKILANYLLHSLFNLSVSPYLHS